MSFSERLELEGKGALVSPKKIGKTYYAKKWDLSILKDAFESVREAILRGKSLEELLKGRIS